jgi:hypothetical protein
MTFVGAQFSSGARVPCELGGSAQVRQMVITATTGVCERGAH